MMRGRGSDCLTVMKTVDAPGRSARRGRGRSTCEGMLAECDARARLLSFGIFSIRFSMV